MIELGAVYTLTGPDGTVAVLNDSTDTRHHVGWVRDITGLDSPEVRIASADLPGTDGAYLQAPGFYGARPITIEGALAVGNAATVNRAELRLRKATDALREDVTLSWWPQGMPQMQVKARLAAPLRVKGGRPRDFQLQMIATDPRIYSAEEVTRIKSAETGATSVSVECGNVGNAPAPHVVQLTGPITSPVVRLGALGPEVDMTGYTLSAGQMLTFDFLAHTVKNGMTSVYSAVDFEQSTWFLLPPDDSSTIVVSGSGLTTATSVRVTYRHAWM